jgi:ketosteroid isomerase-like protein
VVSIYAPDLVSFDIVPPLRHMSAEAKKKNWIDVFATYDHPLEYELRDLTLTVGDGLAIGHSLNRISGTLQKTGERNGYWLRWTTGFRKIGGVWLIVHDHVSVPTDFKSGDSLLNLAP